MRESPYNNTYRLMYSKIGLSFHETVPLSKSPPSPHLYIYTVVWGVELLNKVGDIQQRRHFAYCS